MVIGIWCSTFPDPDKSHSAYFENRQVIEDLTRIIFKDEHNFAKAPLIPKKGRDYSSLKLGPGKVEHHIPMTIQVYGIIAIAIPWLAFLGLVLQLFKVPTAPNVAFSLALLALAILLTGWAVGRSKGPRHPI
ncbi:MAG: hypothetical protein AAFU71_05365 [Cyanobacteria bacterium J06632_22]